MKAGFLGGRHGAASGRASKTSAAPQQVEPAVAAASQPTPSHITSEEIMKQCLQLLRSKNDEQKFVGLLLITKVLPQGSDQAIRDVVEGVGFSFLQRLLLPLSSNIAPASSAQEVQKQQLSCNLALAILGAACRLPEYAGSEEVMQLVPLLTKVITAGGVGHYMQASLAATDPAKAAQDLSADATVVADALDCVRAVAGSGSYGQQVVRESGGYAAAAAGLAASTEAGAAGMEPSSQRAMALAAMQLLGLMLTGDPHSRQQLIAEHPQATLLAIVHLAKLLGSPVAASSPATAASSSSAAAAAAPAPAVDSAMLHLEALHHLALLLPLPEDSQVAQQLQQQQQQQQQQGSSWASDLRVGLLQLLRSRTAAVQTQSALQLAAAAVELLGPSWLLDGGSNQPGAFLQVLVELLKVETSLLLVDALEPQARVAATSGRSSTRAEWRAPQPSSLRELQDQDEMEEGGEQQQQQQQAPGPDVPGAAAAAAGARPATPGPPGSGPAEGSTAGQRAAHLLPLCLQMWEALVELLSSQMELYDGLLDAGSDTALQVPLLGEAAAARLMATLQEVTGYLVEYLERRSQDAAGGAQDPLVLAAARMLGRFAAEAPEAHSEQLQQLLPFLALVGAPDPSSSNSSGSGAVTGLHFLLPLLLQCTSTAADARSALQWRSVISSSPLLLARLLEHLRAAAAEHGEVAAAMQQQPAPARLLQVMQVMDSAVANICQVLFNVLDAVSTRALTFQSQLASQAAASKAAGGSSTDSSSAKAPTPSAVPAAAAVATALGEVLAAWWQPMQWLLQPLQQQVQQLQQQQAPLPVQDAALVGGLQHLGVSVRGLLAPASLASLLLEALAQQPADVGAAGAGEGVALQQLPQQQLQACTQLLSSGLEAGLVARQLEAAVQVADADAEPAGSISNGECGRDAGARSEIMEALQAAGLQHVDGIWDSELEEMWERAVDATTLLCKHAPAAAMAISSASWLRRVMHRAGTVAEGLDTVSLQLLATSLRAA